MVALDPAAKLATMMQRLMEQVESLEKQYSHLLNEHQRAVLTGGSEKSALVEHALRTGHGIDWNNTTILASCHFLDQYLLLSRGMYSAKGRPLTENKGRCHLYT